MAKTMARGVAFVVALAGVFAMLSVWRASAADTYPARPVTIVVPFTPGGSTDILARYEADVLGRALHGTFVVENRPGAGGEIGISYAARAAGDGYTLLHAPSVITLLPYLKKSVSYDLAKDFEPVCLIGLTQFGLVVSPSLHVDNVAELIALAKAHPDTLTFASAGIGTPHQIFGELFKTMTGVKIRHIPYKGSIPGLTDVASGNVSMEFTDLAPAMPLVQSGKLKLIALLGAKRDPDMPNVPTVGETVPGYVAQSWQGLFAHAGTPKAIVEAIAAPLAADLKRPETAARFKAIGIVAQSDTPDEFRAFIASESAKWGKVIKQSGIEPE
ncbi:MAG TPA: tripartite tricarboxylate transporter substrate binding protein [Xanthobacteraceae bacterium]|nr:tripartite tricarboxylate transporter substrate binding protein [Xanthobacteraceae bacterium]